LLATIGPGHDYIRRPLGTKQQDERAGETRRKGSKCEKRAFLTQHQVTKNKNRKSGDPVYQRNSCQIELLDTVKSNENARILLDDSEEELGSTPFGNAVPEDVIRPHVHRQAIYRGRQDRPIGQQLVRGQARVGHVQDFAKYGLPCAETHR